MGTKPVNKNLRRLRAVLEPATHCSERGTLGLSLPVDFNKEFLTQLDPAIGDSEHGINMDRGFKKAVSQQDSESFRI